MRWTAGRRCRTAPAATCCIEAMGTDQARDEAQFSALIERALEEGVVADAVIAQSIRESARSLGRPRRIGRVRARDRAACAASTSASRPARSRSSREDCIARLRARWPGVRGGAISAISPTPTCIINVAVDETPCPSSRSSEIVYGCVRDWHGSISAEHGIGLLKKPFLDYSRSEAEIALMRRIKRALDPEGILNPGKVFVLQMG